MLVTAYVDPDLDGVACAVAYAEFLKKRGIKSVAAILGEMHNEAKYIFERFNYVTPDSIVNTESFKKIILVDSSDLSGLENKVDPEKVLEVIDHRKVNEGGKFKNAKIQIELVGSAATLVAEKFINGNVEISKKSAILLNSAIISNTLNFRGSVTTDRDREAASWLGKFSELPPYFWREMFLAKSDLSGDKLRKSMEGDYALFVRAGKKTSIVQLEIMGAKKLLDERGAEILGIINELKLRHGLDHIFQNIVDLEFGKNFLVTDAPATKALVEKALKIKFSGNIAERDGKQPILRKEIVPLFLEVLDNNSFA